MTTPKEGLEPGDGLLSRRAFLKTSGAAELSLAALLAEPGLALGSQPQLGGVLRTRLFAYPRSLDPHYAPLIHIANFSGRVYSRLITHKAGPDVNPSELIQVPDLAERWERVDDLTYIFHLRKGVQWHDVSPVSGREFTSEDVKATIERILDPKSTAAMRKSLEPIAKVETPDRYTVVLTTTELYAPLLNHLSTHFAWIIPKEAAEGQYDIANTPIGTGPFLFESFKRADKATFNKNPRYFQPGRPYVDRDELYYIEEPATALAAFRSKQIDIMYERLYLDAEGMRKADPTAYVEPFFASGNLTLSMRTTKPPLDNQKVRQAISLAIDRNAINSTLYFNQGRRTAWLPRVFGSFALSSDEAARLYPYDPDRANKLMREAGYAKGFQTSISTTEAWGLATVDGATMIAEMLKEINIDARVNRMEHGSIIKTFTTTHDFEMLYPPSLAMMEADEWVYEVYHSKGTRRYPGFTDPRLDQLAEAQRREMNPEKRQRIFHDIQVLLAELAPSLPILQVPLYAYGQSRVQDFRFHRDMGWPFLTDVWLKKA